MIYCGFHFQKLHHTRWSGRGTFQSVRRLGFKHTKNAPHCNISVTCFMSRIFEPFNLVRNSRSNSLSVQERNLLLSTQAIRLKRRSHRTQRPNSHSLLPVKILVIINTYKNKFSYLWSTYLQLIGRHQSIFLLWVSKLLA